MSRRTWRGLRRTTGVAALALAGAATLLVGPAPATAGGPCLMKVTTSRTAHHVYPNGVVLDTYAVHVRHDGRTQSDTVQRMLMPRGARPRLVTQRLGKVTPLRDQVRNAQRHAVAAVNGDFFYVYSTGRGYIVLPAGASVSSGHIVRSDDQPLPVVGVDVRGKPYGGSLSTGGAVTSGTASFPLAGVNWHYLGPQSVVLFTRRWADSSDSPRPAGTVEWVVSKGRVSEVRTGATRGQPVARGTTVVAFGRDVAAAASAVKAGAPVTARVQQRTRTGTPLLEAVGRGRVLVDGGAVVIACSSHSLVPRPRTTVGWTATGRWATLTVLGDGYDSHGYRYGGLGAAHEANVATVLGLTAAYELDGGGSTTSYVRRGDGVWDRIDDADSRWQRSIPNGLEFVAY